MTPDTAALRALAEGATPGPRELHHHPDASGDTDWTDVTIGTAGTASAVTLTASTRVQTESPADLALVAALDPATVIALCDKADRLDRLTAALRELCDAAEVKMWGTDHTPHVGYCDGLCDEPPHTCPCLTFPTAWDIDPAAIRRLIDPEETP